MNAIRKFKEWMFFLEQEQWPEEARKALADLWWKHHDDKGELYPPAVTRSEQSGDNSV